MGFEISYKHWQNSPSWVLKYRQSDIMFKCQISDLPLNRFSFLVDTFPRRSLMFPSTSDFWNQKHVLLLDRNSRRLYGFLDRGERSEERRVGKGDGAGQVVASYR